MASDRPLFSQPGVLIDPEGSPAAVGIRWATLNGHDAKVKWASGKIEDFSTTELTQNASTDRIEFVSNGVHYLIRELRDTDGQWLSDLHIDLPVLVLETLILLGDLNMDETLTAYALDDSPYVVGLVYTGGSGRWMRQNQNWVQLAPSDTTFDADNMLSFDIDPAKAADFLDLFDKNYVTVDDAGQYESADSEQDDDSDPSSDEE